MQTIYVTDGIIARHVELVQEYERLGRTEYLDKERKRLDELLAIRRWQDGERPAQTKIIF